MSGGMIGAIKRSMRHAVSRALVPHLDEQTDEIDRRVAERIAADRAGAPAERLLREFHPVLHELRTIELRRLPVNGGTLLSAGCAGAWYFEWVDECAGPFERHIGVELYAPEPAGLASNVTWIAESASSMRGVADASTDVVYSGQHIEHLWIDDMVGFLAESNRVLKPGGVLVVDSPNRYATEALGWVHPEHTVELTAGEAIGLFELAGFAARTVRGLWRCRDAVSREWLPLEIEPGDVRELLERSVGRADIDDTFVWWIELERVGDPAPIADIRRRVGEYFDAHWTSRVNRAALGDFPVRAGTSGMIYRTHAFPLFAGDFVVRSSDARLRVRLETIDGRELGSALGEVRGTLERAELGVCAELHVDAPLDHPIEAVSVTASVAD